jgi:hypothetical protein
LGDAYSAERLAVTGAEVPVTYARAGGSMSHMRAVELVFAIGWAAFWIYWLAAALSMAK